MAELQSLASASLHDAGHFAADFDVDHRSQEKSNQARRIGGGAQLRCPARLPDGPDRFRSRVLLRRAQALADGLQLVGPIGAPPRGLNTGCGG